MTGILTKDAQLVALEAKVTALTVMIGKHETEAGAMLMISNAIDDVVAAARQYEADRADRIVREEWHEMVRVYDIQPGGRSEELTGRILDKLRRRSIWTVDGSQSWPV